jgi:ADP-ribosyl-[dinitrogen reductase] hydrolase
MPINNILGGGPYELPAGAFSDDTAVAFSLADHLLECKHFQESSWIDRLKVWATDGIGSSTGVCAGISASIARLLREQSPCVNPQPSERSARELLSLHWILGAYFLFEPDQIESPHRRLCELLNAHEEVVTLSSQVAMEATQLLLGDSRQMQWSSRITQEDYFQSGIVTAEDLWQVAMRLALQPGGFKERILTVVNLGGDADVHASFVGAVLGARMGYKQLPRDWVEMLKPQALIDSMAKRFVIGILERLVQPI